MRKILIIVIDGCAVPYISPKATPNLLRIAENKNGFYKTIQAAVPTVTNVNHASILSGSFPETHGIAGNYYYNRETGEQGFIEMTGFMQVDTILDIYHNQGLKTALLTVKGKILDIFGKDADIGINLDKPNIKVLKQLNLDNPPKVQSLEANDWIFKACFNCIAQEDPDIVYCTTNDFAMHHFAPDSDVAIKQMQSIDKWIGKIFDLNPEREIYITADHGMNPKSIIVNLQHILDDTEFNIVCIPPIKDRYIENHIYQEGGILYLYLRETINHRELVDFLLNQAGIEKVLTKEQAAQEYHMPIDIIGDYVVFAKEEYAFGEVEGYSLHTNDIRTHGSLYEREIPLIAVNARTSQEDYLYSKDIVERILLTQ